jgi:hypothetical protein
MIKEAKDLLQKVIQKKIPEITVIRSAAEESKNIMARNFPFIALVTNPGSFDNSEARTVRYFEGKEYKEKYVRGERVLPILLRCWADGEDEADEIFSSILSIIPSQWECDGFVKHIEIGWEEHSDHVKNLTKLYLSVAEIKFRAVSAMEPSEVPYFNNSELVDGEIAKK